MEDRISSFLKRSFDVLVCLFRARHSRAILTFLLVGCVEGYG
jgi:hypothetical protein